jgi:hypothetical protein
MSANYYSWIDRHEQAMRALNKRGWPLVTTCTTTCKPSLFGVVADRPPQKPRRTSCCCPVSTQTPTTLSCWCGTRVPLFHSCGMNRTPIVQHEKSSFLLISKVVVSGSNTMYLLYLAPSLSTKLHAQAKPKEQKRPSTARMWGCMACRYVFHRR